MIGLLLTTGFVAMAIVALVVTALRRPQAAPGGAASAPAPRDVTYPADAGAAAADDALPPPPPAQDRPHLAPALSQTHGPDQPPATGRPFRGPTALSLRARLAFVHSPEPNSIVLDCTLKELEGDTSGVVPVGAPFTLQLRLPETAWFATSLELLLEQWAEECRIVEIALQARDGHAKAHVGDGSSRLMLEVDSAAGLSAS